ncbi:hypothetical protein EVAR_16578_1 [Eumeta japonica]|uniref:Uncharacterized protein n=1 Tax=Eumeta variegata TaxID=151549 RepID=A0A4C1U3S1_EUMVA|nr:hypothetical protein EVAR_16578_1 [Eumeta japonica]
MDSENYSRFTKRTRTAELDVTYLEKGLKLMKDHSLLLVSELCMVLRDLNFKFLKLPHCGTEMAVDGRRVTNTVTKSGTEGLTLFEDTVLPV